MPDYADLIELYYARADNREIIARVCAAICCPHGCEAKDTSAGSFRACFANTYVESAKAAIAVVNAARAASEPDQGKE